MTLAIKELSYNKIKENIFYYKSFLYFFGLITLILSLITIFSYEQNIKMLFFFSSLPFVLMTFIILQQLNYNKFLLAIIKNKE